jgi:uncharacterized membrane protein
MKKFIDLRGLAIGGAFLVVMVGLGSWWFGLPLWQALLIGLGCIVILGAIAAFEKGDQ